LARELAHAPQKELILLTGFDTSCCSAFICEITNGCFVLSVMLFGIHSSFNRLLGCVFPYPHTAIHIHLPALPIDLPTFAFRRILTVATPYPTNQLLACVPDQL
jgi:hypothetical protein